MAAAWPTTPPSFPLTESTVYHQIKSTFENGKVQSRPKYTTSKDRFDLRWDHLTEAQFQSFKEYFEANQGTTFSWTHPITTTVYTVRFSDDTFDSSAVIYGHRSVRVGIEEA